MMWWQRYMVMADDFRFMLYLASLHIEDLEVCDHREIGPIAEQLWAVDNELA